ncbi:MAG: MFS transporter [Alphaproteobacteria bacterium]
MNTEPMAPAPYKRRTTFLVIAAMAAFSMGQTGLFAVAGPVVREIGMSEVQFGIISSATSLLVMLGSPFWGRRADIWGRRRTLVFSLTAYALTSFLFVGILEMGLNGTTAALTTFWLLLGARLLYGAMGSGIQPASVAAMADRSETGDRSSAVALVGAAFGIGAVLGPASAAFFVDFGILAPLYAIAGLGLFAAIANALWFRETPQHILDHSHEGPGGIPYKIVIPIALIGLLTFCAMAALQQTVGFYVQDSLQVDQATTVRLTGYCFIALAVAIILSQGGVIQLLKPGPTTLLLTGIPILIGGLWLYAQQGDAAYLIGGAGLMGFGFGLVTPGVSALASLSVGLKDQGQVAGWVQVGQSGGFVIGPLGSTLLYQYDPMNAVWFAAACFVLALGVSAYVIWQRK